MAIGLLAPLGGSWVLISPIISLLITSLGDGLRGLEGLGGLRGA